MSDEIPNDLNVKNPFVFVKGCYWRHDCFVYKFNMETSCNADNHFQCAIFATECNPQNIVEEHIAEKHGFYPYARCKGDKYWTVKNDELTQKLIQLAIGYWEKANYTVYNKNDLSKMSVSALIKDNIITLGVHDQDFDNVDAGKENDVDSRGGWGVLEPSVAD